VRAAGGGASSTAFDGCELVGGPAESARDGRLSPPAWPALSGMSQVLMSGLMSAASSRPTAMAVRRNGGSEGALPRPARADPRSKLASRLAETRRRPAA
jgi:hypothetical protein